METPPVDPRIAKVPVEVTLPPAPVAAVKPTIFQEIMGFFQEDSSNSSMRLMLFFVIVVTTTGWITICLMNRKLEGAGDLALLHGAHLTAKVWQKSQEIKAAQGTTPTP